MLSSTRSSTIFSHFLKWLFCSNFHAMKKFLLSVLLLFAAFVGFSQYSLKLVVNSTPKPTVNVAQRAAEPVYVAGNFNNWNPKDENYRLKPLGTRLTVVLKDIPAGMYAFKFTRGDWSKVETTADGRDIADRVVEIKDDMTHEFVIEGWKDDYPDKPKPYTATPQVKVLDSAFYMPQLDRKRRIWIYLPKGYATSKSTYPVLYMHDGQNLFNEQTAPFGEWGVDEAMDSLQKQTGKQMIVVGIDNGGDKRLSEYNPYDFEKNKGEGDKYIDFLVQTLKPYIDQKFRTKKDAPNTFTAGSSMGGLISLYSVLKYPNVFGGAGVFSPAFWTAPQLFADVDKTDWGGNRPKFFFYAGGKESTTMVADVKRMIAIIEKKKGNVNTTSIINPLGQHNEPTWRKQFPDFYKWLVGL
jgi:predicted alpha/beta superfamily hydrolase